MVPRQEKRKTDLTEKKQKQREKREKTDHTISNLKTLEIQNIKAFHIREKLKVDPQSVKTFKPILQNITKAATVFFFSFFFQRSLVKGLSVHFKCGTHH